MDINELREEYKESQRILSRLDQVISNLKSRAKYAEKEVIQKFNYLIEQKRELKKKHQNKLDDIEKYKLQLLELENKLDFQKSEIYELKKERQKLKAKIRAKTPKKVINKNINKINNADDIRESFGFFVKDDKQNIINEKLNNAPFAQDEIEFEKLKKLKKNLETVYHKLHEEIIAYYNDANIQRNYLTNYKNYLNSIYSQTNSYKQNLGITVNGRKNDNLGETKNIANQLTKEMEAILYIIKEANNNLSTIKNKSLKKGENILREIETNLSKINNNKNLNLKFLSKRMNVIEKKIESLKKLNQMLQRSLSEIHQKNKIIENKIFYLNKNVEKYIKAYKNGKEKIKDLVHETIRNNGKNIFGSINKSLNDEEMDENDRRNYKICDVIEEEDDYDEDIMRGITLIKVKDFGKKIDLFKTTILFKNQNEAIENKSKNPKILRKNWNEVCYIYDDYDIHDINFEIKAVGLQPFSYFDYFSQYFSMGKEIKIIDFEINGKRVNYDYDNYCLECDISLYNTQSAKIHLKYKERPKFDSYSKNDKELYNFYRNEEYGLDESLKGQMGKFRIILKGSFEIVKFEDDFFIRNEKNQREKEYIWGGKVPIDGKRTFITLSKREAIFEINLNYQITSKSGNLKDTILYIPIRYIGGNNDIISFDYSSPQTKNIYIDKKKWIYEIHYRNTGYQVGNFIVKGKIRNRCYGNWKVDLTDEMIKKYIPIEDQKDKYTLEKIARTIIADYDKNNEKNILSFLDYAKIGKWVYKNIRYDLSYTDRDDMTAMDIYKQRVGVCHHMTRLANALLYSLGYDVIYVTGYVYGFLELEENCYHAWSLVKLKGKWYPFDATWGIFTGKLPVSHVFTSFFNEGCSWISSDNIEFEDEYSGKFIK